MRGVDDTCEQASGVFHAAGRNDLVCPNCYVNIGTAVHRYQMLCEIERAAGHDFELEVRLKAAQRDILP
jgi:hypothetical protein